MIITIDTKKDSPKDIERAIDILKQHSKPEIESDSQILASIPKSHSTHRPSGPGIFDVQNTIENLTAAEDLETDKLKSWEQKNYKNQEFATDKIEKKVSYEDSTFKLELFKEKTIEESKQTIKDKEPENQFSTMRSEIEHHGGRITRGTAPDFTSYLDLLKQKRDTQVLGMLAEQNPEKKEQE